MCNEIENCYSAVRSNRSLPSTLYSISHAHCWMSPTLLKWAIISRNRFQLRTRYSINWLAVLVQHQRYKLQMLHGPEHGAAAMVKQQWWCILLIWLDGMQNTEGQYTLWTTSIPSEWNFSTVFWNCPSNPLLLSIKYTVYESVSTTTNCTCMQKHTQYYLRSYLCKQHTVLFTCLWLKMFWQSVVASSSFSSYESGTTFHSFYFFSYFFLFLFFTVQSVDSSNVDE